MGTWIQIFEGKGEFAKNLFMDILGKRNVGVNLQICRWDKKILATSFLPRSSATFWKSEINGKFSFLEFIRLMTHVIEAYIDGKCLFLYKDIEVDEVDSWIQPSGKFPCIISFIFVNAILVSETGFKDNDICRMSCQICKIILKKDVVPETYEELVLHGKQYHLIDEKLIPASIKFAINNPDNKKLTSIIVNRFMESNRFPA